MGFFSGPDRDQKEQQLLALVDEGLTFSIIARRMGAPSRNVVLCHFNRMRRKNNSLLHPHSPLNPHKAKPPKAVRVAAPVRIKHELTVVDTSTMLMVPLMEVKNNDCRFPVGDPSNEDFRFCGRQKKDNSSYCEGHHRDCYQPTKPYNHKINHNGKKRA